MIVFLGTQGARVHWTTPTVTFCEDEQNTCQNGGTCNENFGQETNCTCPVGFMGTNCEMEESGSCVQGGCSVGRYCNITCVSDTYPTHYSLLSSPVTLTGESFIRVSESLHPDFGTVSLSIFAYFQHTPEMLDTLFYGTSESSRNLAIFLDGVAQTTWLFYTDRSGTVHREILEIVSDGMFHSLAFSINTNARVALLYVDGRPDATSIVLTNPDLTYGVSPCISAPNQLDSVFHVT